MPRNPKPVSKNGKIDLKMKAAMNQVERDILNAKKVNQLNEDIDEETAIKSFTTSPVLTYKELKLRILAEFPAVMAIIAEFTEIDTVEASDVNFLNRAKQIRPQIQSFLHVCCSKCLWTRDKHPDWVYGFVCILHRISEIHIQILTLSLAEIRLLFSLHMLFDAMAWDDYDRIPQIFSNCGSAAVVDHFIDVIYSPLPHRGSNCWNLCLIVTGVETKKRKLIEWATDAIRLKVLAAYSTTLRDLRSPAECNGWVVSSIGRFIEDSSLCEVVRRSQVMDALQYAASVDNVDESHAGGFDDLLFELCQSRARRDSIMRGEVDASRQWLQTFSYIDPTVPSQELDELDRAYKYFNEEGLSRKGRIPFCRCTPPRPARECNYLSWKKTCSEINVQIQVGQKLLEKGEDEKALQWGHKVFGNVESLASARAPSRYGEVLRARANILQADIYFGKKLYKEALHKYELALGMLKTDSKTLQQHNAAAAASTNSTMRPHKIIVEEYQAKPLYYAAVCNKFLSQLPAAEYYIDSLVNCKATARDANGDSVTVTNPEVERWRVEAVTLQPEIKALVEANSKTIVTDSEKEAALLGQVVIGSRPSPLKCALEKASWKQVGDCRDADGDARNSVHIIPRLRWAIIWVRNELLIWDYCNSRVVHWLKLGERSSKECTETHLVDLKEKGVLCYFSNCLHLNEIMCIDLTQLPPGGSSDASVATVAFLGMPENLGKMHNLVSNLNGGWAFAHNGDLRISDSDPWKFAVSYSKKIAFAKVGGLGVGIFADIKAGTRLGPLNFHTSTPTIYLSHDQLSFSILFLAAPHQDCVITYGQRIAVWDCFSPKKSGLIPRTQVVDLPHTASVVCSREFIFAAAFSSGMTLPKEGESNDPMDPSNIGIWDIAKCRRIATLKPFKDGGAKQRGVYELALKRAPNGSKNGVLCSSHNNGTINIWQFVDEVLEQGSSLRISHLMCHRVDTDAIIGLNLRMLSKPFSTDESSVIPPSDPSKLFPAGKELAFTEDLSVCVASMDTLLVLHLNIRDRKEGYAKSELLTRNCALPACGEWNHVEMPMCSVCRKSFYCNERHQRLDWKRHKLECKPRSQQV